MHRRRRQRCDEAGRRRRPNDANAPGRSHTYPFPRRRPANSSLSSSTITTTTTTTSNKIRGLHIHHIITPVGLLPLDTSHSAHKLITAHTNDSHQASALANPPRCAPSSSSSTPSASTMSLAASSTARQQRGEDSSYTAWLGALRHNIRSPRV